MSDEEIMFQVHESIEMGRLFDASEWAGQIADARRRNDAYDLVRDARRDEELDS